MFDAPRNDWLVPFDGSFTLAERATVPQTQRAKGDLKDDLRDAVEELRDLQRQLYADNRVSLLLMFQAMDAAGKDSTIRHVLSGVNPAGCQVHSFKKPSDEELDHDFLWRCLTRLPERGRIGVFNRSWYEEVLVVRVHPGILDHQRLPWRAAGDAIWTQRLESIADVERHLARNGTAILKFFLNVSLEEQRQRFLARIDRPEKNWKFNDADVAEREHWPAYMAAYEDALRTTSQPWAPWYAIPADDKPSMRLYVAQTIVAALKSLNVGYPQVDDAQRAALQQMRAKLDPGGR